MKKLLFLLLLLSLFAYGQNLSVDDVEKDSDIPTQSKPYIKRTADIFFNGVPAVVDSMYNRLLVSVPRSTADAFQAHVTVADGSGITLNMDGGETFSDELHTMFSGWKRDNESYTLHVREHDTVSTWTLAFTTMPILCYDVDEKEMEKARTGGGKDKIPAWIQIVDAERRTNGEYIFQHYAAMRIRGATSAGHAKKPYSIELRNSDEDGDTENATLFGLNDDDDWAMDAMYYDRGRMRNRVCYGVWNKIDDLPYGKDEDKAWYQMNGIHGIYVEAVKNGMYQGVYSFTDKINRKKLNLKKLKESDTGGTPTVQGILWKGRLKPDAGKDSFAGNLSNYKDDAPTDSIYWGGLTQEYPEDNTLLQWDLLKQFIDVISYSKNKELYKGNKELYHSAFESVADEWLYQDNLVHYMILMNAFYLADNVGKNYFISIRNVSKGHRVLFTPWDMDASFGRSVAGGDQLDKLVSETGSREFCAFGKKMSDFGPMYRLLHGYDKYDKQDCDLNFKAKLHSEWNRLKVGPLSVDSVVSMIVENARELEESGAWTRERNRWIAELTRKGKDLDESPFTEVEFMREWYTRNFELFESFVADFPLLEDDQNPGDIVGGVFPGSDPDDVGGDEGDPDDMVGIVFPGSDPDDVGGDEGDPDDMVGIVFPGSDPDVELVKGLPVLKVSISEKSIPKTYTQGTMKLIDTEGNIVQMNASMKTRGATAAQYSMKPSFNMKLRNNDYTEQDSSLLGLRSMSSWILDAMAIDRIGMRNRVCFDIWNEFSPLPYSTDFGARNGTVGQFVEVYINDVYKGIYCLTDRVNRKLLNLKKPKFGALDDGVEDNDEGSDNQQVDSSMVTIRGVLYKHGTKGIGDQNSARITPDSLAYVIGYHDAWELAEPEDFAGKQAWNLLEQVYEHKADFEWIREHFYLEQLADYQVLVMALSIADNWGNKNSFLSSRNVTADGNRRRIVITPWDLDTSLGGESNGRNYDGNYSDWSPAQVVSSSTKPVPFSTCLRQQEYLDLLRRSWIRGRAGAFSVASVRDKLYRYRDLFLSTGAWQRSVDYWSVQKSKPCYVEDLSREIDLIVQWYQDRFRQMDAYFNITEADIVDGPDVDESYTQSRAQKYLHNYRIVIVRNGRKYDAEGRILQ